MRWLYSQARLHSEVAGGASAWCLRTIKVRPSKRGIGRSRWVLFTLTVPALPSLHAVRIGIFTTIKPNAVHQPWPKDRKE